MANSKAWARTRLFFNLLILANDPEKTDVVFDVADILNTLGAADEAKRRIAADPRNVAVIENRKLLNAINLSELAKLPEGSLGYEYASHMLRLKLDPEFYRKREIKSEFDFIVMRMRQTHDLWHIATGFQTTVSDEIGLQAFTMAYMALPLPIGLVGSSLLKTLLSAETKTGELIDAIAKGCNLGKRVDGLFSFDWEANWLTPVIEIRKRMNLQPEDQKLAHAN